MSQQYPIGLEPNRHFRKKLFVENGFGWTEVKAKVVNPYEPPSPQPNLKEIKIVNGPSHIHQSGISGYKSTMNLLFNSKEDYSNYLIYCGWTHKFYDERGNIFIGSVESIKAEAFEASRRYKVEITFLFIRKDSYDKQHQFEFQDIAGHWAQPHIEEMADLGLIQVVANDGNPVIYFRPNNYITRAEFVSFLNRSRRLMERVIRE